MHLNGWALNTVDLSGRGSALQNRAGSAIFDVAVNMIERGFCM